jgi:hypothetical protein
MMRNHLCALLVTVFACTCVAAEERNGDFGLGFDKLMWGMTTAEVRAVYPSLRVVYPSSRSGGYKLSMANYFYDECLFNVYPDFTNDSLDSIILETDNAKACYLQIKREFLARYGTVDPVNSMGGKRLAWSTKYTLVWLIGDHKFLHIAFEQARGSPHHVIYDTVTNFGTPSAKN